MRGRAGGQERARERKGSKRERAAREENKRNRASDAYTCTASTFICESVAAIRVCALEMKYVRHSFVRPRE